MKNDYAYAVARIRARELELLDRAAMNRLLESHGPEEVFRQLTDRGWGDGSTSQNPEEMFARETAKTWELMEELLPDPSVLDILKLKTDYHNLKAAVKLSYAGTKIPAGRFFCPGGTCEPELMLRCARERDYGELPEKLAAAGREAGTTLLRTGDGQLCDMLLDRACMEDLCEQSRKAGDEALRLYGALTVAAADIRTAVRCGRTGKSLEFAKRALVPADGLNIDELAAAALEGGEQTASYLEATEFAGAAAALRKSDAAFERWYNSLLMERLKAQKFNSFTVGPLAAYVLARENEIRYARMILSAKQNQLSEETIRERLGELYV